MTAINTALIAARRELHGTVFKGGTNQAQRYSYVSHEDVTLVARPALLKHGLVLEQRSVEYMGELTFNTKNGAQLCWRWKGVHALVHESGEERLYSFEATTGPNDKAAFVASTALDRTAHLRILELAGSQDENPEADVHDRQTPEPPRPVQAPRNGKVDATTFLDAAFIALQSAETDAQLVEWFRKVDQSNVEQEAKQAAFKGFADRCKQVGLIAKEVAGRARQS